MAQLLARHADTRIDDTERKLYIISNNLFLLNFQRYASAFGKLRRIVNQICENLRKAQRVAHQNFRDFRIHVNNQFDGAACNTHFGKGSHFANNILQNKLRNFKVLLIRFDFREVQNIIYNSKKRCSRMANAFDKTLLAFVELRFLNQMRHTDNGIHRRADFMAHVRKELALGLCCTFCDFSSLNDFRNINHRKHVTHNRVMNFKRTGFAAEPRIRMRVERLEHKSSLPGASLIKRLFQSLHNILVHSTLRQVSKRQAIHIFPIHDEIVCKLLRHVLDSLIFVKNHKNRDSHR